MTTLTSEHQINPSGGKYKHAFQKKRAQFKACKMQSTNRLGGKM